MPKPRKPLLCFISYNHADNHAEIVKSIANKLNDFSEGQIKFLLDEDLEIGGDLDHFMDFINEVHAVIILLTPGYKKKADERTSSGVYDEYRIIIERLESEHVKKKKGNHKKSFFVIPLILSSSHSESCPKLINNLKALDFTDYHVTTKGELPKRIKAKYDHHFQRISSEIVAMDTLTAPKQKVDFYDFLKKLFIETKHDNISNLSDNILRNLYVKTHSFEDLKNQTVYFFLGRKGSGKSTLGPLLYFLEKDTYKDHVHLNVDNLNLEYIINIILNDPSSKDIGSIIPYNNFFQAVWEIIIYVHCFRVIKNEFDTNNLSPDQLKYTRVIIDFIENKLPLSNTGESFIQRPKTKTNTNSLFAWSVASVKGQIASAIKLARTSDSEFHYDLNERLSQFDFIYNAIPENVIKSFHSIMNHCKRNFFISFDGFDNMFEKFRQNSAKYEVKPELKEFRENLEYGFLEGFMDLVFSIKSNQNENSFYQKVDLCASVPKDRFLEIKNDKRDSYRYIDRFHEIKWSGIELAILLRKRLELVYDFKTSKALNAFERLDEVLNHSVPNLPETTSIFINSKTFVKNTFINILRHTFWRPREILIYYSKILSVLNELARRGKKPDNFTISKIISETTFPIIKNEFLNEFKNYCLNLESILDRFKHGNQIVNRETLDRNIGQLDFIFINGSIQVQSIDTKIEFLYDIGFLGFELSQKAQSRYSLLTRDVFCFNVSFSTFEILQTANFEDCNFIIHPIFCEYLDLDTSDQTRLTIDFDWNYLSDQDIYVRR